MRALCLVALITAFAGCGSAHIAIDRPAKPIYAITGCRVVRRDEGVGSRLTFIVCPRRFDARALLGLTLIEAERVAGAHHALVREVLRNRRPPEVPTLDLAQSRVDVATTSGIVTRIVEIG